MAWLLLWGTTSFSHLEQADYLGRPGTASLIYYYYDMKCFIIFSGLNIQVYVISYTRHKHTHARALFWVVRIVWVHTIDIFDVEFILHRRSLQRKPLDNISIRHRLLS